MTTAADIELRAAERAERDLRPLPAIELEHLTRTFAGQVALDGVSMCVEPGEIHALVGPNGAGKTTLLRVLAGLTAPSSGSVRVLGAVVEGRRDDGRRLVAVVPAGDRSFYLRISGIENLLFFARLHGFRRRAAERLAWKLLERVGLVDAAERRVGEYSTGMQKRLAIARALLPRPRVLLVDEATHDLDPLGAREIRALVAELAAEGAAVVWATQRLDEIDGFAPSVTVLQQGRVRFQGSVSELLAHGPKSAYHLVLLARDGGEVPESTLRRAAAGVGRISGATEPGAYVLHLRRESELAGVLARLVADGVEVHGCRQELPDLEQAFLSLTTTGEER